MTDYNFNKRLTLPHTKKNASLNLAYLHFNDFLLYATFLILKINCPDYNSPRKNRTEQFKKLLVKDILKTLLRLLL